MLEAYLAQLATEAGKTLSPAEVEAMLLEAKGHLKESIQARLELGETPEEAERQAVAAFGSPVILIEREPLVDPSFLLACFGILAFWGIVALIRIPPPAWSLMLLYGAGLLAHAALIVCGTYPRRFQGTTLAFMFLALWTGWSTFQAANHVIAPMPQSGEDHRMHRSRVPPEIESDRRWAKRVRDNARTLLAGHESFLQNGGTLSPSRRASFSEEGSLRLFERSSRNVALDYWRAALTDSQKHDGPFAQRLEQEARELQLAAGRPWWPNVPSEMGYSLAEGVGASTGAYLGIYIGAWLAGKALRRRSANRERRLV